MTHEEVATCLDEYGEAIRGDWGSIDGRSERAALQQLAEAIREPDRFTPEAMRRILDICPYGCGHWTDHCDDDCANPHA